MSYETSEQKRAELVRFRLEELKPLLEKVGRTTNNKLMKDIRNQLAHCAVTYTPDGRVFMQETSVMGSNDPRKWIHLVSNKHAGIVWDTIRYMCVWPARERSCITSTHWNNGSNCITSFGKSYQMLEN